MTESDIQTQIVCYLSSIAHKYKFMFFSVPNESLLQLAKTLRIADKLTFALLAILKKMGMTPGVSDLVIASGGRMFCLEVKTTTGKQSPNQVLFESWCASCGVPYRLVRNMEEVAGCLIEWGVIR